MEIELVKTCGACPEQYDVYINGQMAGYLRLRHGLFRAEYPDVGGETVYQRNVDGDGVFDQEERMFHLGQAVAAIMERHGDQK